jgi:hypothetical protein
VGDYLKHLVMPHQGKRSVGIGCDKSDLSPFVGVGYLMPEMPGYELVRQVRL